MLMHCRRSRTLAWKFDTASLSIAYTKQKYPLAGSRTISSDGRNRLSSVWTPTGGHHASSLSSDDPLSLLVRAGYLRQAYAGIFHLLPLGLRVQERLERLIEKFMNKLGASKVSLSSISSDSLWRKSGRLDAYGPELFHLDKKKASGLLLSPTHEEEMTQLVARSVQSYKELPLRLYQISRKYRNERRPRGGLLRAREFLMKDLYTFDSTAKEALDTYQSVRLAYNGIFDELKIPYLVAEADSGAMGGAMSHEYHFPSSFGEDNVISCSKCSYVTNEEKAQKKGVMPTSADMNAQHFGSWTALADDGCTLVNVFYPSRSATSTGGSYERSGVSEVDIFAVRAVIPSLDASMDNALSVWESRTARTSPHSSKPLQIVNVFDERVRRAIPPNFIRGRSGDMTPTHLRFAYTLTNSVTDIFADAHGSPLNLLRIRDGDACPRCSEGLLTVQKAVELAHTFYLGSRYSGTMGAGVTNSLGKRITIEMGCHGIGVSRLIGTVASMLADDRGLNWPKAIAPYDVVIVPGKDFETDAVAIYDLLVASNILAPIIDDRSLSMAWKLKDADLVGYPLILVLGKAWRDFKLCEIQCRVLDNLKTEVALEDLSIRAHDLLHKL